MARRVNRQGLEEAAAMFKALADPARLQTLIILAERERNVGDLADIEGDKTGTVSARLKVLLQARLVRRRRDGKSVIYSVADRHVLNMIENAVDHAAEHPQTPQGTKDEQLRSPKARESRPSAWRRLRPHSRSSRRPRRLSP
jgi:ArsR family transcriptional regulator